MKTVASEGRSRVGLVIGSGAVKCAAALGLWKLLQRERIPVDMAVGCSGGAIYAALIAQGWSFEAASDRNQTLWEGTFEHYDYRALLRALFQRRGTSGTGFPESFGLVDDRRINRVFETLFADSRIEDTRIPLHIAATDLENGDKVVLSSGRIADALRASIAIPFVLRPWRVGERLLFDGAASDPLPIDIAVREGCDIIIAMGFENAVAPNISHPAQLALQTSAIAVNHLMSATYAFHNLAHHAELIPVIPDLDRHIGLRDTDQIPAIIEAGERAALCQLPYLLRLLNGDGDRRSPP